MLIRAFIPLMTTKQPDFSDLNALAIEACDMWQEHLSTLASNPDARAELTRFLEPQRRLFADWASMMKPETFAGGGSHDTDRTATHSAKEAKPAPAASAQSSSSYGDDPLRTAQLALRLAELEKRVAELEADATKSASPRRTQRKPS